MSDPADTEVYPLAATVILMREVEEGPPELLMLERAATMAFAAGALVFPGGRVDDHDLALADTLQDRYPHTREGIAQRIAAIRETIEEAGIAIGILPAPSAEIVALLRSGLANGRLFGELLQESGVTLDLDQLTAFAHWRPPRKVARRFDTRFFLAAAPKDAIETADGTESVSAFWATARALLEDADAGRHLVIFPTWCNLDRLAQFGSLEEAKADAALYGHHLASGRTERRDGVDWLCVPEGIGYPTSAKRLDDTFRG